MNLPELIEVLRDEPNFDVFYKDLLSLYQEQERMCPWSAFAEYSSSKDEENPLDSQVQALVKDYYPAWKEK